MIKKFNKLMDDIPLIFKLIIGVIMCAILTLMGLILFFFFLPEVNAAALTPTNQVGEYDLTNETYNYVNIGQNTNTTAGALLKPVRLFVSNFYNVGTGTIEGEWYIRFPINSDETCSRLQDMSKYTISVNDIQYNATKRFTGCTISNGVATLRMTYSTTNTIGNATFKTIYYLPKCGLGK